MSFPTFSATTTAEEVADALAEQIRGKNVLITGTSINGIGYEAARVIAKFASLVVITGYNAERLQLSANAIKESGANASVRQLNLDLNSLESVRKAAAEVNAYAEPLHVVVHNAAYPTGPLQLTKDGLETQMSTAHFGPFLFTKLIYRKLLSASTSTSTPRVVTVSSRAQLMLPSAASLLSVDNLARGVADNEEFAPMGRYAETKAANVFFAKELAKRAGGRVNAYSLHPGDIYTNIMQKEHNKISLIEMGVLNPDGSPADKHEFKTIPQGAATTVVASFDPRIENHNGAYLWDCVVANDKLAPYFADS
ncbi:short-chain dehydrogenase/reductase family protein, partial [Favolaschia claudopus]